MSVSEQVKKDYDNSAVTYNDYSSLPSGQLESQLIKITLGDCTGLTILDLGGGTGVHAREAIDLGAATVDIIDISPGMLKIGRRIEESLCRENTIRFFEADVSKPFSHLPLCENGYDVVMANWIFSFADTLEVLEGMFHNIVSYLKPGGRFVGVRDADPRSPALENNKYGGTCTRIKDIPGGVKYLCVLHCIPPIEFEGASLEIIYSGSTEMYERFGLTDIAVVPYESAEVVQKDPEFWQLFLERPNLAVVQAVKGSKSA
ncbi:S-adenosyl-L-methionine-dependent methyltransferase [Glonium stellatum]|uniref:S-adenosyl-L-methionine-dependent methyltransferase n=1 Tax=Glonium stellatum TaxID=574774 RepID=A0A8E2JWF7_9PEZI|nr:S-adenosyl-L-methionine-dependent methyltransferase [Glonium stellatum]